MEKGVLIKGFQRAFAIAALGAVLFAPACARDSAGLRAVGSWALLYTGDDPAHFARLANFDLAVVDPDAFPKISDLKTHDVVTLAYLSVGEAESYRAYWPRIQGADWIVRENPNWKENFLVDVRAPQWRALLLDEIIPPILAKGFDGLLLDTLDTAPELEESDPVHYAGARAAMIELVRAIKTRYPKAYIVPNNGLALLEEMAPHIDGLMVEDLTHGYNFETKTYEPVPADLTREKLGALRRARALQEFPVFLVDYAKPGDTAAIARTRRVAQENNLVPYVTTVELDRVSGQFGRTTDE